MNFVLTPCSTWAPNVALNLDAHGMALFLLDLKTEIAVPSDLGCPLTWPVRPAEGGQSAYNNYNWDKGPLMRYLKSTYAAVLLAIGTAVPHAPPWRRKSRLRPRRRR